MMRGPYYDKNGVKRGAWSKEEDEKLRACVERYGHSNWRQLPKHAGLARCGKSCRLRWLNYLRPGVKRGNYTKEEDQLIIKLHQQLGNKWSVIAKRLPGRSDNEIKNHWHGHLKKHMKCNHAKKSELKKKACGSCEGETTKYSEPENPLPGFASAPFSDISSESSPPIFKSSSTFSFGGECDANAAAMEIFDEPGDFWTQPFLPGNIYDLQENFYSLNYAANETDMDGYYSSYLFDNAEFFGQVIHEFPGDPKMVVG